LLDYLDTHAEAYDAARAEALLPPLFKSYLRMGAKICGTPALDREFYCIDFLTVIKVDQFNPKMKEKYELKA
jgi:putative hemolysin